MSLFVSPRAKGIARKWKPKRAETAPQHQRPYKSLQKWKETSKGSSPCGPTTNTQYRTDYQCGIFFGVIFVSYYVSFLSKKGLNCALCLDHLEIRKPESMGETVLIVIGVLFLLAAAFMVGWLIGEMFKHQ